MDTAEVTQREAERGIPRDTFRARLYLARQYAGDLTIRDAAARCGLNYGSWANWESGVKPRDKIETAQAISEGLGVDYDWLLHGGPLAKEERRSGRVLARGRRLTGSYPAHGAGTSPIQPTAAAASATRRPHHPPDRPPTRTNRQHTDRPVRLDRPDTPKRDTRRAGDDVL